MAGFEHYDRWKASPYEDDPDDVDCQYCGDDGDKPNPECWSCDGTGRVSVETMLARAADEAASRAEDEAIERYYHDKYGD